MARVEKYFRGNEENFYTPALELNEANIEASKDQNR